MPLTLNSKSVPTEQHIGGTKKKAKLNNSKTRKKTTQTITKVNNNHTYFIKSKYYPEEFIDNLFKIRGNWKKLTDTDLPKKHIDFVYLDDLYYLNPKYYSLHAIVKNTVNDDKRVIAFKNNLIKNFASHPNGKKYILPQIEIDLYTFIGKPYSYILNKIKPLFVGKKIYIFKPVTGFAGTGIKVFSDYSICCHYIIDIISKYKHLWKNNGVAVEKMKNRVWVLQEYLTNPLTIKKDDGKDYKFHIRHFYIYSPSNNANAIPSYYKYIGRIAIAEKPYIHGDWENHKIHDTHFHNSPGELFPDALKLSPETQDKINKQIAEFYQILNSLIHAKCYTDSQHCFELFGVDLMLTDDFDLKVLEVNHGIGLGDSNILSQNKAEIFKGILELIVDKILPPKIPVNTNLLKDKVFISIGENSNKLK